MDGNNYYHQQHRLQTQKKLIHTEEVLETTTKATRQRANNDPNFPHRTLFGKVKETTFTYIKRKGRPQTDGHGTENQRKKEGIKNKPNDTVRRRKANLSTYRWDWLILQDKQQEVILSTVTKKKEVQPHDTFQRSALLLYDQHSSSQHKECQPLSLSTSFWSELYEYFVELCCPLQKPQATFIYFNLIKIEFENEMLSSSAAPATFQVLSGYLWLLATLQVECFYCCINIYGQHWLEWGQTLLCSAWEILAPFSFWQRWVNLW